MKSNIKIIILFIIVILIVTLIPGLNDDYIKSSKLYISEIMANNSYTIQDEDGEYSDYIEIHNKYKYPINLDGYYLSDDEYAPKKWRISNIKIEPNQYLLIFASGKDKENHTNFKLNSEKESVMLSDDNGNIISKLSYENMQNDISYGYIYGKYIYSPNPTPKQKNSNVKLKRSNQKYDLIINEYMIDNKSNHYSKDGYYYDWVELYNYSNKEIDVGNLYLTDDITILNKYKLPNIKISKKDYLLIYLSGNSNEKNNDIYANFKLSSGEHLILSDGKNIINKIKTIELPTDISYGKKEDSWYYFTTPTPGYENNTAFFSKLGA